MGLISVCWILVKKREKCYWFGEGTTKYGTIPFFSGFGIIHVKAIIRKLNRLEF